MLASIRAATFLFAYVIFLGGCAGLPDGFDPTHEFEMTGRVAIRYGGEAASARVSWRHGAQGDDLLITNPLGQGVARISRAGSVVTMEMSDGRRREAQSAESLTEEVLGWRLPLSGLPHWIRARPHADAPHELQLGEDKRPRLLRQAGWEIEYQEYEGVRPLRLRLTRPDLEIRLVIESWREKVQ